jgi:hypothetical protein
VDDGTAVIRPGGVAKAGTSPALGAAIRLLEEPAGPLRAGRGVQDCGDVGGTAPREEKRSINSGGKLAVRQGFEF